MTTTIIDKINESPDTITEEDVDVWILPEVVDYFEPKYGTLAYYAYGQLDNGSDVARRAFKELATETLQKGLNTFLFKSQHWRTGRKIHPYLYTCLNRLADNIKKDVYSQKKISSPVCPGCKSLNQREFLLYERKHLRCNVCTNEQDSLKDRIKREKDISIKTALEAELNIKRIFALHSRKGYRCPDCSRFIPRSYVKTERVSCPYDKDCAWFGVIEELEPMAHPLGLNSHHTTSLNSTIQFESGNEVQPQDLLKAENIDADVKLQMQQNYSQEISVLQSVIKLQHSRLKSYPQHKVIKKLLMYEAFSNILERNPEDMVSYLVHQNHSGDLPIQSRIFQEFVSLVENSLPIKTYYQGEIAEIYSLQDPRLDLFTGFSEFEAYVKPDSTIPNKTKEVYVGGRKMKDFGPCFIGQLVDIRAVDNNQSLLGFVNFYTFSQIKMSHSVPAGVKVRVQHFRIPSHYEMNGLVFLQRSRRRIVDSVYYKLNGKKRIAKNNE